MKHSQLRYLWVYLPDKKTAFVSRDHVGKANVTTTCKLLWEQQRNYFYHHCQQSWHLRAGCCCIWQQIHNYRKDDTSILLHLWHYPSPNLPTSDIQIGGKTAIPVLVLAWGIFHIFTSGKDSMMRAVWLDQDSLWNVNGTLWYLTLVSGATSLSDRGRRLHESSYLYRE